MNADSPEAGLFKVDAFTTEPFCGNPAAVCVLDSDRDAAWMQQVAKEMNLSETAFLVRDRRGWRLRWFSPTTEVPLCGHATLASAAVLWHTGAAPKEDVLRFSTLSGELTAERVRGSIELDFPAIHGERAEPPDEIRRAFPVRAVETMVARKGDCGDVNWLLALESEDAVRELVPDLSELRRPGAPGVVVTARSNDPRQDIVSRYFAPGYGIDEDPATGSIHCFLATFWCARLEKTELLAHQASRRGGFLRVRLAGDRVKLGGDAVIISYGVLVV